MSLLEMTLPGFATRPPKSPFTVAIEGPNGAGKTTLCGALAAQLSVPALLGTDKAWFSERFKVRMIRDADWFASAMFFLSGCFEQMRIVRASSASAVLLDRSMWSTLAVHAATEAVRLGKLLALLRPIAAEVQVPDLTIVLEASFETCSARIAHKDGTSKLLDELTLDPAFHARERDFYHWLACQLPSVVFLDVNSRSPSEVVEGAKALVEPHLPC